MNELAVYQNNLPTRIEDLSTFVSVGREKMTAVRAEIRAIDKLGLAEEVRRKKLEEAQMISEAVLDAEVRIGSLTMQMPKASGGDRRSEDFKSDSGVVFEKPKQEAIRELGFIPKQIERFETLAKHPEIVEQAKAQARENDDIISRSFVLEKIKHVNRETRRTEIIQKLESIAAKEAKAIQGIYDVIVMDPPWPMQKIERDKWPNQVVLDYPTMTLEDIAGTDIPAAENCHIWLWTTQKFLPIAMQMLETWGLKYICTFVWHKNGGFQPFGLPQYNCEFVLYARKGTPEFIDTKAFPTCFSALRGAHSEKPDEFYNIVRRVTAGRRLDMFSRREIDGFDGWGKEV